MFSLRQTHFVSFTKGVVSIADFYQEVQRNMAEEPNEKLGNQWNQKRCLL